MVNLRLQSILASMAKYYWILHYLSGKHTQSGDQKTGHRSVINYCLEESSYIMNNEESVQG